MSFSIQTNIAALYGQQNLGVNSNFQQTTIARLTSGYRINSSADDAAGLAIANSLRSKRTELVQGVRNANDGVSQLQIVDGGLSNISQILDRLKVLATQAASGTFTGDYSTLNNEFKAQLSELDRQAGNVGLNSNGNFNAKLSIYIGGGIGTNGAIIGNPAETVDLSNGTVSATYASQASSASTASTAAAGTVASTASTAAVAALTAGIAYVNNRAVDSTGLGLIYGDVVNATSTVTAGAAGSTSSVSYGGLFNILSTANAQSAILAIQSAIVALGKVQGTVGAGINELNFAIGLAQSQVTNYAASESRIRDADIAAEASNLTKAQTLQQSGLAALAQANQIPQSVLKLLQ